MTIVNLPLKKSLPYDLKDVHQQCRQALNRAVNYLVSKPFPTGGWSDFPTNRSGASTSWVTAHVLWNAGDLLPSALAKASFQTLMSQRHQCGGWGFSQSVPPDCDSTLYAIQAMLVFGANKVDILESVRFVLSHQSREGGFSTYNDQALIARYRGAENEGGYDGWTQSHVCVTAVALETLIHFPNFIDSQVLNSAMNFLLTHQSPEGYWESYWWRSKYFATTRIIRHFRSIGGKRAREAANRSIDWLLRSTYAQGYWVNGYDSDVPCVLSTAGCIKGLLLDDMKLELAIRGVLWLLESQNEDGSWSGIPILQIPPPNIKNPAEMSDWKMGGRGVGSCCVDENRIYTTATVIAAVRSFISEVEKWNLAQVKHRARQP